MTPERLITPEALETRWAHYLELARSIAPTARARAAALGIYAEAIQMRDRFERGTKERSVCTRVAARAWRIADQLRPPPS